METMTEGAERRVHDRFKAKEHVLVLVGSDLDGMLFHVLDISRGGLAFSYPGTEKLRTPLSRVSLVVGNTFCLDALPVTDISDTSIPCHTDTALRRKSLKFGTLTPEQETIMEDFLYRYTTGCS
jgi:hypothetical protein